MKSRNTVSFLIHTISTIICKENFSQTRAKLGGSKTRVSAASLFLCRYGQVVRRLICNQEMREFNPRYRLFCSTRCGNDQFFVSMCLSVRRPEQAAERFFSFVVRYIASRHSWAPTYLIHACVGRFASRRLPSTRSRVERTYALSGPTTYCMFLCFALFCSGGLPRPLRTLYAKYRARTVERV